MMKALQFGLIGAFVVGFLAVSAWLVYAWSNHQHFPACSPGSQVAPKAEIASASGECPA
jgi:hypothetical protein